MQLNFTLNYEVFFFKKRMCLNNLKNPTSIQLPSSKLIYDTRFQDEIKLILLKETTLVHNVNESIQ